MADTLVRAITKDKTARVVVATTRDLVAEGMGRHNLPSPAGRVLGQTLSAGLLLATLTKGGEKITLQLLGDGPLRGVTVDANDAGEARGYVSRPDAAPLLGQGIVHVVRDLGRREPYGGQAPIVSLDVDENVEHYLNTSEQIDSALGCEVAFGPTGAVAGAGGILVQCLPGVGAGAELVARVRTRLREGALGPPLAAGETDPVALARAVLEADVGFEVLDSRSVRFRCTCSADRVASALALVGRDELASMIRDDGSSEVTCNFCSTSYHLDAQALAAILRGLDEPRS